MDKHEPRRYAVVDDPVVAALVQEAIDDHDVIGVVLQGSRALGRATHESDYDVVFVVDDETLDQYELSGRAPGRGQNIVPPIVTDDIWHEAPRTLTFEHQLVWDLPAWADSVVVYDRDGRTTALVDTLRYIPEQRLTSHIEGVYDGYLNALYRSLKCWRRGDELGARLECALEVDSLLHTLFALERRWRSYSSRLWHNLDLLAGQGWAPGELRALLIDLISTSDPRLQQAVGRRVTALLRARGHGGVEDAWDGRIAMILEWQFPSQRSAIIGDTLAGGTGHGGEQDAAD